MRHHRTIHPITMLLTVATAIALFCAGWVLATPAVADPSGIATEQIVRAFYDAVNQTLRTGDAGALDALLDQHVIVHGPLAMLAPDRAGLADYLASLHGIYPQLDLHLNAVTTTGNRAVVEITLQGADADSFLGGSLTDFAPWGAVDALLATNHRIVELWTDAAGVMLRGPIAGAPMSIRSSGSQIVTLDRMKMDPGAAFTGTGKDEVQWLIGEQPGVAVTFTSTQSELTVPTIASPTPLSLPLGASQILAVPIRSQLEVRNGTGTQISLLVLTVSKPNPILARTDSADSGLQQWWSQVTSHGVSIESLTGDIRTDLPPGGAVLSLAQASLAPNAELVDLKPAGPCLFVVEAGTLDLVTPGGATMTDQNTRGWRYGGALGAGSSALIPLGTQIDLRNRGVEPVEITVIAFLPAFAIAGGSV
ncbi:MAG: nuclear transport factor 2 family protein [Thermomicrobiales bacterium]